MLCTTERSSTFWLKRFRISLESIQRAMRRDQTRAPEPMRSTLPDTDQPRIPPPLGVPLQHTGRRVCMLCTIDKSSAFWLKRFLYPKSSEFWSFCSQRVSLYTQGRVLQVPVGLDCSSGENLQFLRTQFNLFFFKISFSIFSKSVFNFLQNRLLIVSK